MSSRWRASASGTREVSIVIQRRPHFSDTCAVVPEPHEGSRTKSPGIVESRMQRSTILLFVCTTYSLSSTKPPVAVSAHRLDIGRNAKSSQKRAKYSPPDVACSRLASARPDIPAGVVPHHRAPGANFLPSNSNSKRLPGPGLVRLSIRYRRASEGIVVSPRCSAGVSLLRSPLPSSTYEKRVLFSSVNSRAMYSGFIRIRPLSLAYQSK